MASYFSGAFPNSGLYARSYKQVPHDCRAVLLTAPEMQTACGLLEAARPILYSHRRTRPVLSGEDGAIMMQTLYCRLPIRKLLVTKVGSQLSLIMPSMAK